MLMRSLQKTMLGCWTVAALIGIVAGCGGGITGDVSSGYDGMVRDGWSLYNRHRYDDAYRLFLDAREFDDTRPEAAIGCGWSLLRRQHPDSAAVTFKATLPLVTILSDSVDALTGLAGSYLASGEYEKTVLMFSQYTVSSFAEGFPLRRHDFFLDEDDLEIVQAMALYRLGKYSPTESADPDNALYHLNRVLAVPHEYANPQTLMEAITASLSGGGGLP